MVQCALKLTSLHSVYRKCAVLSRYSLHGLRCVVCIKHLLCAALDLTAVTFISIQNEGDKTKSCSNEAQNGPVAHVFRTAKNQHPVFRPGNVFLKELNYFTMLCNCLAKMVAMLYR